jgi:hypothetical protein
MMTVYVDDSRIPAKVGRHESTWCHLIADSQAELHEFAMQLGLRRSYFQPGTPRGDGSPSPLWHYDVTEGKRKQAVALGAVQITWRDSVRIIREREARKAAENNGTEHQHEWQDTARLQKTCWGCDTVAACEHDDPGGWVTTYRPTLRAATAQRLAAHGIGPEDAGLQQVVRHNAALGIRPAEDREAAQ